MATLEKRYTIILHLAEKIGDQQILGKIKQLQKKTLDDHEVTHCEDAILDFLEKEKWLILAEEEEGIQRLRRKLFRKIPPFNFDSEN
ncbi:MAG: hypothetical protein ACI86H_001202 [bacterium]|jgi:hypothetical protein